MNNEASGWGNPDQMMRNAMIYRCSFCKRGFSNAQALGGHMNIHRKDRAKLKEFSDDNLFTLDISKAVDFVGENLLLPDPSTSEEAKICCHDLQEVVTASKRDLVCSFAETPSISKEKSLRKNKMELIHGELDLELRLGPQPNDSQTSS